MKRENDEIINVYVLLQTMVALRGNVVDDVRNIKISFISDFRLGTCDKKTLKIVCCACTM